MSRYIFEPSPARDEENNSFVVWNGGFTSEELDSIINYCEGNLYKKKATVYGSKIDDDYSNVRISKTAWIKENDDTRWFYDRMAFIARSLNSQFYNFDLYGFVEDMQYTIYEDNGGHYDWHIDSGGGNLSPRKFSMVLQLSDPDDYEGGDLQFLISREPVTAKKERGMVAAFPSYRLHRVTPVTKGIRKTIVIWVSGPKFR